jgi:hypothetical protein
MLFYVKTMLKLTRETLRLGTMIARLKLKEIDGDQSQAVEHVI